MKILLTALFLNFMFILGVKAQSDTLVIHLKNNQLEKILISQIQSIKFENITGVSETQSINKNLQLAGNHPNPFAELTNIEFDISAQGNVEVAIYDNSGKQVQILKCENCPSGRNSMQWDCRDFAKTKVPSGIYYYEVRFNNETMSKKMILVK